MDEKVMLGSFLHWNVYFFLFICMCFHICISYGLFSLWCNYVKTVRFVAFSSNLGVCQCNLPYNLYAQYVVSTLVWLLLRCLLLQIEGTLLQYLNVGDTASIHIWMRTLVTEPNWTVDYRSDRKIWSALNLDWLIRLATMVGTSSIMTIMWECAQP